MLLTCVVCCYDVRACAVAGACLPRSQAPRASGDNQAVQRGFIPDALADKKNCRAYIGFGKDPAPDWFIILHTVDGDVVVVQGQSKCLQADGHVANMALFEREYGKRLKDFKAPQGVRAIQSVFVLATDATVKKEAGKRLPEDAVIIDRNKRTKLYNPFGAVLREYYQS